MKNFSPLVLVLILAAIGGVIYLAWPQTSTAPTAPIGGENLDSVTPQPVPAPSITTKVPTPTKTPSPAVSRDTLTASMKSGTIPLTVAFTAQVNFDRSCSGTAYIVNFGDNTEKAVQVPLEQCTKPFTAVLYHQYERAGTFTATLFTKLVGGAKGAKLSEITITAKNPVTTTGSTKWGTFSASPTSGSALLTVDFTISATDGSEANGIYYSIAFGDGSSALFPRRTAPALSHTYTSSGGYSVTVSRQTQCSAGACSGPSTSLGTINISVN